jgi:hypothetical protein
MATELALGYKRGWSWSFADRVLADGVLANGVLANWAALDNRLRVREVRSDRRSHKSQGSSPNDHEFQHRRLLLLLMIKNNLMIDTDPIKQMFSQSFFDECCKHGTKLDGVKLATLNELLQRALLQKIEGKMRPVRAIYAR